MPRRYTAQEMREMATEAEVIEVADQFFGHDMDTIAAMLRQAADLMELEKEYEYAVIFVRNGKAVGRSAGHYKSYEEAMMSNTYCPIGETISFIRREVGDWEEVNE